MLTAIGSLPPYGDRIRNEVLLTFSGSLAIGAPTWLLCNQAQSGGS